jgi:hypothetical protein
MGDTSTAAEYDRGLILHALESCAAISGLSLSELDHVTRANGETDRNAALQLIELIEHLSALVGNSPSVQSDWFKSHNLDLGETPLALLNSMSGIECLRDYLAGQRYRS